MFTALRMLEIEVSNHYSLKIYLGRLVSANKSDRRFNSCIILSALCTPFVCSSYELSRKPKCLPPCVSNCPMLSIISAREEEQPCRPTASQDLCRRQRQQPQRRRRRRKARSVALCRRHGGPANPGKVRRDKGGTASGRGRCDESVLRRAREARGQRLWGRAWCEQPFFLQISIFRFKSQLLI